MPEFIVDALKTEGIMLDENGKVVFNEQEQAELDRIIQERVARVKAEKPEDYDILKEIASELDDFGYQGTAAEKREAIKAYKAELKKQQELADLQHEAQESGTSPELLAEIKALKSELAEIKGERQAKVEEEKSRKQAEEAWSKNVSEFEAEYPDVDLEELGKNPKFIKFVKGKALPLKELYSDFAEFIGETEAETIAKVKSKEERSTSSGKGANSDGGSYGLTERQKGLAKAGGMTYKEYAELIRHVN